MRDAIQLSDMAMDHANKLRELFNTVGEATSNSELRELTEEELVAMCIFFTHMTLQNPMTLMSPHILVMMKAAQALATEANPIGKMFRDMMANKPDQDEGE